MSPPAPLRVVAIVGSLRTTSSTAALARAVARVAPAHVTVEFPAGIADLPHFSPDLDVEPLPPAVAALRARLGAADALLVTSPEYAHGMPGALKNALDWLVSATEPVGKPVLLVSASPAGAVHAHAQLSEVLRTMSLPLIDGGAHVFSRARLDDAGEVADPAMLAHLGTAVAALLAAVASAAEPGEGHDGAR
ncbi:MAG: NAD(P)H-dependent oxidoreductase [Myxococcales bacterium]|nr:NAD(P)H-dependent oxidoreductase [Myxococcales bacterium]